MEAILVGTARQCLVIDLDADMDGETGALAVDAATLRMLLRPNGGSIRSVAGPYVRVGPVESD